MRLIIPDLVSPSYFPAIAAVELGLIREQGLDVELELMFPVTRAAEALRDGEIDFLAGAAHAALYAFPQWRGVKLVTALSRRMYWLLLARADLGLGRGELNRLKGLRIGAAPGPDLGLRQLLIDAGLDPEAAGISIEPVPGTGATSISFGLTAAQALAQGRIDAFWANGMGAAVALRSGVGTIVLDVRRGDAPWAQNYTFPALLATDEMLSRDPAAVLGVSRAIGRAQQILRAEPERAEAIGRAWFPAYEAGLIADLVAKDVPYYEPVISPAMAAGLDDFARRIGLVSESASYEQMVAGPSVRGWAG